ncbi:MAG: hypothetical protein FJ100_05930 [Deltaproteobacteria bacterium]|nr:hypothetical protein [Deltaproteobacteria bacterium]
MRPPRTIVASTLVWTLALPAIGTEPPGHDGRDSHACPIDGTATFPIGTDGKTSPKLYTDLEIPTQAYTNLVVACPKCGYASWTSDFSRPVDAATEAWVKANLAATARRAAEDPAWAYRHHVQLLQRRGAPLRERIGALVFQSYVLKRRRPRGGSDANVEREIASVRRDITVLLAQALREDPPKSARTRLEWAYLLGELTRLVGEPGHARPLLADVCAQRDALGITIGKMACDQAEKAAHNDTFEEYRDGVINPAAAIAGKPADPPVAPTDSAPPAPR